MKLNSETDESQTMPILLNYGGANRSLHEMSEEELQVARQSIVSRAKEKAFSKGLPVYYVWNGKVVAEYADGSVKAVPK